MFEATVTKEAEPGHRVIAVVGDLDLASADTLVDTVRHMLADGAAVDVTIDLTGASFLDSSGVRALLLVHRATAEQGGSLRVSGARGIVADVLRITAVDEYLGVVPPAKAPPERGPSVGQLPG